MGFSQWFWRLFLVFTGLIAAHALLVTLLVTGHEKPEVVISGMWVIAGVTILCGGAVAWYCSQRIFEPLAELSRRVQAAATDREPIFVDSRDEIGVVAGAFNQLRRDLAGRIEQISQYNERLQTILGSMIEGVLAVGPDGTILLANEAARRLLDFAAAQPIGRPLLEVTRDRPVYEAVVEALQADRPIEREFDAPGPVRRTLSLRATRLPGDPCPGVMVVLHDVTELRRLENLRRELVANVSHELKTPLTAIKGYAETLSLGAVNDPEHNLLFVHRIEEQADRLNELVQDILQIARMESGQETFDIADLPAGELIELAVQSFADVAAARQIALVPELPPPEASLRADEEGVRTILNNLIDNALKYTPAGGRVTVRALAKADCIVMEVEDTGIGVAAKDQARIFERFYRADKARSRELGGTGLGLSIVKHLAHAFGGSVSVESQPGKGSKFRVELPRGDDVSR